MSAAIALEQVHKHYETGHLDVHALRGIDLEIQRGEWVSIMGPSGSGKTTLLEILGCLSRPSSGRVMLGDVALDGADSDALATIRGREIGFVFQAFNLLPRLTLEENVALPLLYQRVSRAERRERALEALARVQLDHRAEHRPSEVSGGERQRAAIARALVNRPSLILADEPTGNLDTVRGQEILALMEEIHAGGATLIIVTHDPAIGARAPRCLKIQDGELVADDRTTA
jgi:putative ABC transport system ATP-binding protein